MIESKYILDILEGIIEGESYSDSLKSQIECLTVRDCEYTDAGVFVHFNHSEAITKFKVSFLRNSFLGYLLIQSPELGKLGAEAVLFFSDGLIDFLEIYCIAGDYPHKDLEQYTLVQEWMKYK